MSRWNGSDKPAGRLMAEQRPTLTKRGMIAAICAAAAAAESFVVPACHCGAHVHRDGLCRDHMASRA